MDHSKGQTQRQFLSQKRSWCCPPHSLTCLVFIWQTDESVSPFSKGLYVIRGKDSAKEKKICSFIRLELMRCQGDSLQRCWLFLKDNWETLLFSELGRLVPAHAQIRLAIWAKVRSYGWCWQSLWECSNSCCQLLSAAICFWIGSCEHSCEHSAQRTRVQYSFGFQGFSAVSTYNQKCHVVHHLAFCVKETGLKVGFLSALQK